MSMWTERGLALGALVEGKQAAYGDAVSKTQEILAVLWPDGVPTNKYDDLLLVKEERRGR